MVWYFIGVYIINRTLLGCLEIRNFSSRVEKIFHSFAALTREIFSTLEEKFRISARPCNILYLLGVIHYYNQTFGTATSLLMFYPLLTKEKNVFKLKYVTHQ